MLKVTNLRTCYGNIEALKGISLEVHDGEILTLIGANGAGKTTFLRTVSGILKASAGTIEFDGQDVTQWGSDRIVQCGISQVPEGRQIFSGLTVHENVKMGAFTRKDSKKAIEEDIDKIYGLFPQLAKRRTQMGGSLSGGEQQMLAMGRAMMSRPKLLLLDEPSMGLAPIVVEGIFQIIKDINAKGTTILLVEQNAKLALAVAQRGYVLETGTIALMGNSAELANDDKVREIYLGG